ncbi:hypothetical protein [Winogradskyella flava]|uniref:Lipoprotein n=1 Tax=Winogradskyella flava TaxID=1884876 RepID=A0A842IZB5_9FLAO|nr:hypothetical protein [Winogradskyella flava]MBC2846088.1 hypothetical protein [Winogradskyella flava]
MKLHILAIVFTGILISCNSSDKTTTIKEESPDTETIVANESNTKDKQLKPIDTDEALIATALMSAPEESRANCKVIGYNMTGEFVTLREGDNQFIVLADDPKKDGFNAACYHKDLEPFMARGRTLKAEGKNYKEVFDIREAEMKAGKLKIPNGATLHIYYGKKTTYDPETSKVEDARLRYVVYMPWATAESTGLPEKPYAANHPWIMNPGTHRAHIMISPVPEDKE